MKGPEISISARELLNELIHSDTDEVGARNHLVPEEDAAFREEFIDLLVEYHVRRDPLTRRERKSARDAGRDLHVEAEQALLEPLQNAMAVGARVVDMGFVGRGTESRFVFAHDGDPFQAVDVFALVVPHESAKRRKAELEGQFGTGISALTRWGSRLILDDSHYRLLIDANGEPKRLTRFVRPKWCSKATTVLATSLEREPPEEEQVEQWVKNGLSHSYSSSNVLLIPFSRTLCAVRFHTRGGQVLGWVFDRNADLLRPLPKGSPIPITLYEASMVVQGKRSRKGTGATQRIVLAATPAPLCQVVFNPLPLSGERNALPFGLSAPFDVTGNRERLRNDAWNASLWHAVGEVAGQWVRRILAGDEPQAAWKLLAVNASSLIDSQLTAADAQRAELTASRCIRSETGDMLPPAAICFSQEPRIRTLLTSQNVGQILNRSVAWIDEALPDSEQIYVQGLRWLGAVEVTIEHLITACGREVMLPGTRGPLWRREAAELLAEHGCVLTNLNVLVRRDGQILQMRPGTVIASATHAGHSPRTQWDRYWQEALTDLERDGVLCMVHPDWTIPSEDSALNQAIGSAGARIIPDFGPEHVRLLLAEDRPHPLRASVGLLNVLAQQLSPAGHGERLEAGIGTNIEVEVTVTTASKGSEISWATPASAYLPDQFRAMSGNRGRGSRGWGTFADGTPGLRWINTKYLTQIEGEGRKAQRGALALFSALGAAPIFHLQQTGNETDVEQKGGGHARRQVRMVDRQQLPYVIARTFEELDQMLGNSTRFGLVDDFFSPDLVKALDHYRRLPLAQRRERGVALLSALVAYWGRIEDHSSATPAGQYRVWRIAPQLECPATWLAELSEAEWMVNGVGELKAPRELYWPNPLTLATKEPAELAATIEGDVPMELRHGLGLDEAPPTLSDVIDHLGHAIDTNARVEQVRPLYHELDRICRLGRDTRDARKIGAVLSSKRCVLCTDDQWRLPGDVIADEHRALYGDALGYLPVGLRPFDALWAKLGALPKRSLSLHARVWNILANGQMERQSAMQIVTATLDDAVSRVEEVRPRRIMLPVMGGGWAEARSITAVDDSDAQQALAAAGVPVLEPIWPVWRLRPFLQRCKIHYVERPESVRPEGSAGRLTVEEGQQFEHALEYVLAIISREYPHEYASARIAAQTLRNVPVVLGDATAHWPLKDGRLVTAVVTSVLAQDDTLYCVTKNALRSSAGGGALIALALRATQRRRIALEWHDAFDRPDRSLPVTTPSVSPANTTLELERLRRAEGRTFVPKDKGKMPTSQKQRKLRQLPNVPMIVKSVRDQNVNGGSYGSEPKPARASGVSRHRDPLQTPAAVNRASSASVEYTHADKEDRVRELLELLQGQEGQFKDLRTRFGTGADYIELGTKRAYEIKAWTGAAPDSTRLTDDQIQTAFDYGDNYILIVAEHLEDPSKTRLIWIANPMQCLKRSFRGHVVLEGLHSTGFAIEFGAASDGDTAATGTSAD